MSLPNELMPVGLFGTGAVSTGYSISRSLRFNSADSAYLSRTPASSGNRKTWTWAGWVKRSGLGRVQNLFRCVGSASDTTIFQIRFMSNDAIGVVNYSYFPLISTSVYRDSSAWYHIVVSLDTTQSTASNRLRFYINGSELTTWATDSRASLTQNSDQGVNQASVSHEIGGQGTSEYFSGYLASVFFIDGQALDPSSFTETNATTGQLIPKAYTGSYGTNGFHLDFADNASTTTIGYDAAGSNDWTANNLSVTAGSGNDSLVDVPTNGAQTDTGAGGEVRGNYCTLNPLAIGSNVTLSNGNLDYSCASNTNTVATSSIAMSSGKWYCEFTATSANHMFGLYKASLTGNIVYLGVDANGWGYYSTGQKYTNSTGSAYGSTYTTSDVIGVAFDADAGSLYFYKNGAVQNSGTAAFTGLTSGPYVFATGTNDAGTKTAVSNFGQRPFAYTAPSGFKALNTANLPAPVVTKPSTVFDAVLYTGTGSALTPTSSLGFNPDLVWIKGRSGATDHALYDSVRGVEKRLESNTADTEVTSDGGVTAFNTAGFSVGTLAQVNTSSATYAAWAWDAGSSTVTNTSGSITSQVRANASAGFSVVTYTGTGSNATVGHGLGVAPAMILIKRRNTAASWEVYHSAIPGMAGGYIYFNLTNGFTSGYSFVWNNTSPTSSAFSIGSDTDVNANGSTYVAYCFAPVVGYSSFGSYVGNGSTDGSFTYLGFLPKLILIKRTDTTSNWTMLDTLREGYNVDNDPLYPNLSNAEGTTDLLDITSNGFKLRSTDASVNASGGTYIFAAWASNPFQYSRAR